MLKTASFVLMSTRTDDSSNLFTSSFVMYTSYDVHSIRNSFLRSILIQKSNTQKYHFEAIILYSFQEIQT